MSRGSAKISVGSECNLNNRQFNLFELGGPAARLHFQVESGMLRLVRDVDREPCEVRQRLYCMVYIRSFSYLGSTNFNSSVAFGFFCRQLVGGNHQYKKF